MKQSAQLKSILKASGWSQEELAQKLNVSFVTLNSWVNDRSLPRNKASESIRTLYFEIIGSDALDIGELEELKDKIKDLKVSVSSIVSDEEVLNKLILYLTYNTNVIEGSTMTLDDTNEVLFKGKSLTNKTQREQSETLNHRVALLWVLRELENKEFEINEDFIRGVHLRLMNGIIDDAGQYRSHSVRIMGSHVSVANYLKIPSLMKDLISDINEDNEDPINKLSITHSAFEKIHPFSDGNGRVGRLIMLAQAFQMELMPPLVLKERRLAYYKYLELAQTEDKLIPLEIFVAESVIATNKLLFDQS